MNFESLAAEFGTPLYVYDAEKIVSKYKQFCGAFDVKKLDVFYACKALTNINVLQLFLEQGAGLDCVSIEEIELGLLAGCEPEKLLFTPNGVGEEEYEKAIRLGVKINVDNIPMLEYVGQNHPDLPICIRMNPHIMAGGNGKISVGHIDSKFGISIHQMPHVLRLIKNYHLNVEGVHVHTGSDILDADIFIRAAELVFDVVRQIQSVNYIDFGSGFKVPYKEGDLHTNIEAFGKKFSAFFNAFCKEMGKDYTLKFEPGKFFVSEAGSFLTEVSTIKQTTSCVFIGVNSGFNHLIRPMFYDAYHHVSNLSNPKGDQKIYNIVGYICESDTFGTDRQLTEVRKGDVIKFDNAGAYCFSMALELQFEITTAEVLLEDGKARLIRKRETLKNLIENQVFEKIKTI